MSTSSTKCDSNMCANKKSIWNSECDNSYQKSKYRRKKRRSVLIVSETAIPKYHSSRLGFESASLPKSSECYHQTRLSYEENAQISTSTARPTCVFDCYHETHEASSISNNLTLSSRIESCTIERTRGSRESSLLRKRSLNVNKTFSDKSNLRHCSSVRQWYRVLFFLIHFIILNQFIELTRVESFGHHGGLTGGGLMMKGGLFAKSDRSKMSVIPEKLISPKKSSKKNEHFKQKKGITFFDRNQMQADSPFNVENLQEIMRNIG